MDFAKDWLKHWLASAFTDYDSLITNATNVLSADPGSDTTWGSIISIADALKPFCYVVIAICLLIEIAQVAAKVDLIKWEHGLKVGVKMCLSKVMIDTAPTFLKACYYQASKWISDVAATGTPLGAALTHDINTYVDELSGFFEPMMALFSLLIPIMAIKICGLMVEVIAYGRMFEMYCLLAVSPLPCAFFPLGDGSGGGFSRITRKFLLNFVGVCLHGVMIMVSIKVYGLIIVSVATSMATAGSDAVASINNLCYAMLLGGIVLVMACAKSGQWAKSILDA